MQLPDRAVSDKGGVLALVLQIQAWLTSCLKELLVFLWVKAKCFMVYTAISVGAFNPCLLVTTARMFNLVSNGLGFLQPVACCFAIRYGSGLC